MKIKIKDLFWYAYFIIIALPLHQSNGLIRYLSITGMISVFHVIMILLTIYYLTHGGISKNNKCLNLVIILFLISIVLGVIMGVVNGNQINNILGDGGMYLLALMILVCASAKNVRQKNIHEFLSLTYKASSIMLIICVAMYITRDLSFWKMISFNEGRYFGGFLSILIVTLPYGLYNYIHLKKISLWSLCCHVILGFFCMIVAQSRATIISSVLGMMFVLYFGNRKITVRNIIQVVLFSIVALFGLSFFMRSSFDIVGRILSTDFSNRSETIYARFYLYQYYIKQIFENPFGKGFGSIMYFLTPQLTLMTNTGTYTIDAVLMAAGYKSGWLLFSVFAFSIFFQIVTMIKLYRNKHDKVYLIMLIAQSLFIASTGLITAQIIHTYTPLVYFWTFMGVCASKSTTLTGKSARSDSLYDGSYKKSN